MKESHTVEELAGIVDLRYRVLRQPWNQSLESARDELEDISINAFIEDVNGIVIACGRLQKNSPDTGQIRYMAVDEKYQGQGLGKLILDFLEKKGRSLGLTTIELQARENAVKFYEHNGYKIREKSFFLWGIIQHYLMDKKL